LLPAPSSAASIRSRRSFASRVTGASCGASENEVMNSGSKISTRVLSPSSAITTLQRSIAAIRGSAWIACSASWGAARAENHLRRDLNVEFRFQRRGQVDLGENTKPDIGQPLADPAEHGVVRFGEGTRKGESRHW